jgi:hypothetical protein
VLDDVLAFGFADADGEAGGVLNDEDLELAAEALGGSPRRNQPWGHDPRDTRVRR